MLANEFLAFEHSPLFFVDIIIHCSLLRTCRVRVEEKEEFLVYTVLWTLTCHPYLESATALSDNLEMGVKNFMNKKLTPYHHQTLLNSITTPCTDFAPHA